MVAEGAVLRHSHIIETVAIMSLTLRHIAARLGLSPATVSRALHGSPLVNGVTMARVKAALKKAEYQLDPVVSAGMSKIRKRSLYRETLAWCGDHPRESMPWLGPFFEAVESYGARLGYAVEYFHFEQPTQRTLGRLGAIWKARGIRGVMLGPFRAAYASLEFPWEEMAWVSIGHGIDSPALHSVGRDYASDMQAALTWLKAQGCRRPCCVLDPRVNHLFRQPILQAMLVHYHGVRSRPAEPIHELHEGKGKEFAAWMKASRADGIVLPRSLRAPLQRMMGATRGMPVVLLSSPDTPETASLPYFSARYEMIGQGAVGLLHQMLSNREFGLPTYRQTVALSSYFSEDIDKPA